MKRRKLKLVASLASLGLVVAVMGVGVWAASQQAVKISSTVSFTATSVAADIKLNIRDNHTPATLGVHDILQSAQSVTTNFMEEDVYQLVAHFENSTQSHWGEDAFMKDEEIALTFQDKPDTGGETDGELNIGAQIIYSFKINIAETSAAVFYKVNATTSLGNYFTVQVQDITNDTAGNATNISSELYNSTPIAAIPDADNELEIKVVYQITTAISNPITSAHFGNISIELSNKPLGSATPAAD